MNTKGLLQHLCKFHGGRSALKIASHSCTATAKNDVNSIRLSGHISLRPGLMPSFDCGKSWQPSLFQKLNYATFTEDIEDGICWKCMKPLPPGSKFNCKNCNVILPPSKRLTYFEMLDVSESFDTPVWTLQKNFKDLQRMFHPDKFSMSDDKEKEISALLSSSLNKAYTRLLSPLSRGMYMLELKGIFVDEKTQLDDAQFLMEVMELNEQIAEAEDDDSLRKVQRGILGTCDELIKDISKAFEVNDYECARSLLIKLRYYENMAHKLKEMIPPS